MHGVSPIEERNSTIPHSLQKILPAKQKLAAISKAYSAVLRISFQA
jgi:hypothetical protein